MMRTYVVPQFGDWQLIKMCVRPEAQAALSRQGRYQQVRDNLRVKEVKVSEHERFIICHNPAAADRDAAIRQRLIDHLQASSMAATPQWSH